jgi:hypothetical protein
LLSKNVTVKIHRSIILCVVFCESETLVSHTSKEHTLRVCENRVLRGIFRPERGEVTGGWRELHN